MSNNKIGFDFYRCDTDRYLDIKIKRLKKQFKCNGVCVYDNIVSEIYRLKGSFLEWDENVAFDIAEYWELEEDEVNKIVEFCCQIGLFDVKSYTNYKILTSKSIQDRYLQMCISAKRQNVNIPEMYRLNSENLSQHSECSSQNTDSLPQSRKEDSKKEKREERGTRVSAQPPAPQVSLDFIFSVFTEKSRGLPNWDEKKCKAKAEKFFNKYENDFAKIDVEKFVKHWVETEFTDASVSNNSSSSSFFPNAPDKRFEAMLPTNRFPEYWAHLRSLGYVSKKDKFDNIIGWVKT